MAVRYLTGKESVLEIGGNIGRNSLVIASILNNSNFVTLECDTNIAAQLVENRDLNNFNFHIESSALSKRRLIQKGWDTMVSDDLIDGWQFVNTITLDEADDVLSDGINDKLEYIFNNIIKKSNKQIILISATMTYNVFNFSKKFMNEEPIKILLKNDEVILDLEDDLGVYIIYYLTDDDNYEFYAEVGKESRMEELLSDGENKEEE
jgi:hypothetical protein